MRGAARRRPLASRVGCKLLSLELGGPQHEANHLEHVGVPGRFEQAGLPVAASLPRVLIGRGTGDKWYDAAKAERDLAVLRGAGVPAIEHVFDGGHVWDRGFVANCGAFVDELLRS